MKQFNLPDVGEGLQEAEIVQWNIQEGDLVEVDQIILVIETDKASVEIPSPYQGKIIKLYGKPGDVIEVGKPLVDFEDEKETEQTESEDAGTVVGKLETGAELLENYSSGIQNRQPAKGRNVRATPAVRALATKMGVDINGVTPTGPKGSLTKSDVENAAANGTKPAAFVAPDSSSPKPGIMESQSFEGEPLKGAKRSMALNMNKSHSQVALVTLMEDADITDWGKGEDLTVRMVQALIAACKAEPALNVHYNHENLSVKPFEEIHLGIAVDTKDGLYVPVLKKAENMNSQLIREAINQFKTKAQEKTFLQEELKGATLILSNFGGIGGRYATPMVVPPMVAIIGVGRMHREFDLIENQPKRLKKLPLSLSFDHRAVTGGEAARFLITMIKDLQH